MERPRLMTIGIVVALAACSSNRDAGPIRRPDPPVETTTAPASSLAATTSPDTPDTTSPTSSTTSTTSTTTGPTRTVTGSAVAGTAGEPEAGGPPYPRTDPFAEAVRLEDGTCVGWADAAGGSTAGLEVGAPLVVLDVEANEEIGSGTITASRAVDMAAGGEQWNCLFDFTATVTGAPAEFRIRVATLEPWLARPDPSAPDTFVASVNSDASIGLISSCPALPDPAPTTTTAAATSTTRPPTSTAAPTTAPAVSGWKAVGQYWSRGVDALCRAGLPVTAIARPCRPAGSGSEYIVAVIDSDDPTEIYADGAAVPRGTELTVVVATGRLCG